MIVKCANRAASMTAAAIFLVIANASASTTIFSANVAGTRFVDDNSGIPESIADQPATPAFTTARGSVTVFRPASDFEELTGNSIEGIASGNDREISVSRVPPQLAPQTAVYSTGNCSSMVATETSDIVTIPSGLDNTVLCTVASSMPQSPGWPLPLIGGTLVALGLVGRKNKERRLASRETRGTAPQTPEQLSRGIALVAR